MKLKESIFLIIIILFCSCSQEINIPENNGDKTSFDSVHIFFAPNTLGDCNFSDAIHQGVVGVSLKEDFKLLAYNIASWSHIEEFFPNVFELGADIKAQGGRMLFIFADPYYNNLLKDLYDNPETSHLITDAGIDILVVDSRESSIPNVNTLYMPAFAPFYYMGEIAKQVFGEGARALTVALSDDYQSYPSIKDSIDGFKASYHEGLSDEVFLSSLALEYHESYDESIIYNMSNELYDYSTKVHPSYDAMIPICRGNISGPLRFNRSNSGDAFHLVGTVNNYNNHSDSVPFSVEMKIGDAIGDWLTRYLSGSKLEKHETYTFEEGYYDIVISSKHKDKVTLDLEELKKISIEKEKAYEESK